MLILTGCVNEDMRRRVANVILTAIERAYGSVSKACIDMDVKQANFNDAMAGQRNLPVGMLCMSKKFYAWFAVGLAEEFGIPREVRSAFRLMFGVFGRRRMARAELRAERKVA